MQSRFAFSAPAAADPSVDIYWAFTMVRCVLAVFAALCIAASPALAQGQRNFPADALRGTLVVENPPEVWLNGSPARLASGARIRGQSNMLAMSGALAGQRLLVHYTVDVQGYLKDVWILTPEEAARRPWPTTPLEAANWKFDSGTQTWSRK